MPFHVGGDALIEPDGERLDEGALDVLVPALVGEDGHGVLRADVEEECAAAVGEPAAGDAEVRAGAVAEELLGQAFPLRACAENKGVEFDRGQGEGRGASRAGYGGAVVSHRGFEKTGEAIDEDRIGLRGEDAEVGRADDQALVAVEGPVFN